MSPVCIGFIGFGEVGRIFAQAAAAEGAQVRVFDILFLEGEGRAVAGTHKKHPNITIASLPELVADCDYILSTVTTDVALQVAQDCAALLRPGKTYVDLNSTSPEAKKEIGASIEATGADFVEGAILGAVGASGAATRVLLSGSQAQPAAERLSELGLNCLTFGSKVGDAAAFKMLRSVFSKGIECLLIEMLAAGRRAGIDGALWEDVTEFMSDNPFEDVATNWIQSHAVAYERRYHEMVQVVESLEGLRIQPVMSQATKSFFERSLNLGLDTVFTHRPEDPQAVIAFMAEKL